ncbi:predicted protein [Streptomyces sp. SPB78]|nr:predicted protein [Streptomyces sp. SPB78]
MPRGVVGVVAICSCQQSCRRHGCIGGHAVRSSLNFLLGPIGSTSRPGRRSEGTEAR